MNKYDFSFDKCGEEVTVTRFSWNGGH